MSSHKGKPAKPKPAAKPAKPAKKPTPQRDGLAKYAKTLKIRG